MNREQTPPAIVREADSLKERMARIKAMHAAHLKTTLEQARDIGKELSELREQCRQEQIPWTHALVEVGVSRRTASRNIRIWENWSRLVANGPLVAQFGVAEALIWLAGADEEDEEQATTKPAATPPPTPPGVLGPSIFCRDCRTRGPKKDCKQCKALRTPPTIRTNANGQPTQRTGTGDDSHAAGESVANDRKPKPGAVLFDWKTFNSAFGALVREIDRLGNAYRCKESPAAEELRTVLKQFKRQFKDLYQNVAKQKPPEE
jgi:hypothetical protein